MIDETLLAEAVAVLKGWLAAYEKKVERYGYSGHYAVFIHGQFEGIMFALQLAQDPAKLKTFIEQTRASAILLTDLRDVPAVSVQQN